MIIGIDVSSIQYGTGVSNYTLNLVKNLITLDKVNTYKLVFISLRNRPPPDLLKLKSNKVTIIHLKIPISIMIFIWNNLNILPIELIIGKCHVFHTSDYYHTPTLKAKLVTTIHDLTVFLHPKWINKKIIDNQTQKFNYLKKYSHFICVSKTTQADFLRLFPKISKDSTSVIYEASEDKYLDFLKLPFRQRQKNKKAFKQKYLLSDFILAQGTREPRKNLARLIKAFILFKKSQPNSDLQLAITGKYGWGKDISKSQPDFIKILGYLPETDMVSAHASALALAYPSLYEGFGLPVLKAMAVGTPVITSTNTSMAEITKKSALLVDPTSIKDIKDAIEKIYLNQKLIQRLSTNGIKLASLFSWSQTAKDTLEIYKL